MAFIGALIAAIIVTSFTDWLLFGVVFHDRYLRTLEVWRPIPEGRKIAWSMVFAAFGHAGFLALAMCFHFTGAREVLFLAFLVWLAASLPQTVTNTLYVKYAPELVVSHSIGWLVRLLTAAAAYLLIVRP